MYESSNYQYFEDVNWGLLRLWGDRRNLDVLDVGCGFATTSQHIAGRGNRVTGIESSAEAVAVARGRVSDVVHADLQQLDEVTRALAGRRFDVIIFADVLEHLAWPIGILRGYLDLLKDGGSVIVSLPNVGLWSVRLNLLAGRFHYEETGVLDRTHLRFFTRRTLLELLRSDGLRVVELAVTPVPLPLVVPPRWHGRWLPRVHALSAGAARGWPGGLAYQFVAVCRARES